MLRIALAGLRGHAVRLVLTGLAIVVGVGFLAGTLVYGDTATAAFYGDLARSARGVDVAVQPADPRGRLPVQYVERIRSLPGVATVDGRVREDLPLLGTDGRLIAGPDGVGVVLSLPRVPALAPYDVAAGRLPVSPTEIAVDRATVDGQGFSLGSLVRALGRDGKPAALTLVGVLDVGVNRRYFGRSVAALTDAGLGRLVAPAGYAEIAVTGTDPGALRERIETLLGSQSRVLTGDTLRHELAQRAAKYVDGFLAVLVAFGLVALTVCGFVIYNTFAILATQRSRELALLRCVGAGRRQIIGAVLLEALVLGLCASLVGLLASVFIGYGLIAAREVVGAPVPNHVPVVDAVTVAVAVAVGTVMTVMSAAVPAIGASRVPPLAALRRPVPVAVSGRPRRVRLAAAGVFTTAGLAACAAGTAFGFAGLPLVLGGAMITFIGVVAAAPFVIGPLVSLAGWLPGRVWGTPARLATGNARRNPYRTAAVATALLIGVALMSMLSVLLATARAQSEAELTENFPVDFVLTQARVSGARPEPVPGEVAAALRSSGQFEVAEVRTRQGWTPAGDRLVTVWAGERADPEVTQGSLAALRPGRVALARDLAWSAGLSVGDSFSLGQRGTRTIVALYDDSPVDADVLLSLDDFAATYGPGGADRLLVDAAPGPSPAQARLSLDAALRDYPLVRVATFADTRARLSESLDELLAIFAALLGLSVGIAVFGIGNTLTLSVLERTRESATLRALGLSRTQLRRMLLVEAGLIAAVGTAGGVIFGVGVGWLASLGLIRTYGHGLPAVPAGQLVVFAVLAVAASLVAGVLPARRAARTPVATELTDA